MKRLLFLLTAILPLSVLAQNADQQKAWMDYMTPGNIHQMIAKSDGDWTFEMKYWMSPDAAPTTTSGTTENKMTLGGRYQESVHKAQMEGMAFEGHGVLAYDNAKKIFQNTWIDNMGTGIMYLLGKWDDATKSITFTGKSYDPMAGKDVEMKQVYKMIDDDHHSMEMYMPVKGKETKTMEITFTRKK